MKKTLFALLFIALITALPALYLKFIETKNKEPSEVILIPFPDTDCRPNTQRCIVSLLDRQLSFFFPKKALYLQAFPVEVFVSGFNEKKLESIRVRFEMLEMNMGFNQVQLSANKDLWSANAMLPLCASGRSDWKAIIDVSVEEKIYRAVFNFEVSGG